MPVAVHLMTGILSQLHSSKKKQRYDLHGVERVMHVHHISGQIRGSKQLSWGKSSDETVHEADYQHVLLLRNGDAPYSMTQ